MKNESIHILNFNENFNEIENYDVLNIEQRIRDIVTDLEDKQYFFNFGGTWKNRYFKSLLKIHQNNQRKKKSFFF